LLGHAGCRGSATLSEQPEHLAEFTRCLPASLWLGGRARLSEPRYPSEAGDDLRDSHTFGGDWVYWPSAGQRCPRQDGRAWLLVGRAVLGPGDNVRGGRRLHAARLSSLRPD